MNHIEWIYDLPDKVDKAPDYNSAVSQRLLGLMQVAEEEIIIFGFNLNSRYKDLKKYIIPAIVFLKIFSLWLFISIL